ncbi:MAG: hypothetical protein IJK86_09655 [Lachnospiraceae bacterium]|nr:hypothetical protein [Lachnospiraceae bacterium]
MNKTSMTFHRDALYQEIWDISLSKVAKKYGISPGKLKTACIKANIPLPTNSYWGKLQAGKPVQRPPLPDYPEEEISIEFSPQKCSVILIKPADQKVIPTNKTASEESLPEAIDKYAFADRLSFLSEDERKQLLKTALSLHVNARVHNLHPVLQAHKVAFSEWAKQHPRAKYVNWNRDPYRRKPENEPPLWESVTESMLSRVYHILDPIYKAVEHLGGSVNDDLSMIIRNEHVVLKITEKLNQTPHALTKDEIKQVERYEREKKSSLYVYEPRFRKYDYIPTGKLRISAYGKSFFRDTGNSVVEEQIGNILVSLYLQSEDERIEREKREEEQRKIEEEKRRKELQRQKYNNEVDLLQELTNKASDYEAACKIRAFIAAVEEKPDPDKNTLEWIRWAKAKADWLDPSVGMADPIFGLRNHGANQEKKDPVKKSPYYYW